jgi:phospholipid transport system substrate-binding protein
MRYRILARGAVITGIVLATTAGALAGPATDQLKPQIDDVIATLDNPALQAESRSVERREAVRAITDRIFDWTVMARQALGQHWQERTVAEKIAFVPLFRELMEQAFIGKIEQYGAESVAYVGESLDGDESLVRTRVTLRPSGDVGVDYRMAWQGTRWMIYDVLVERTSIVRNYRAQFDSVIKKSSYEELIRKIRGKVS